MTIQLDTSNLKIISLSLSQMQKYLLNNGSLEQELKVNFQPRILQEGVRNSIANKITPQLKNSPQLAPFITFWILISKSNNNIVGEFCFKGSPDQTGSVEIGYATYEHHRNKGYMYQAVSAITKWSLTQPEVKSVKAGTSPGNAFSQKILEKTGFIKISETTDDIWWVLKRS